MLAVEEKGQHSEWRAIINGTGIMLSVQLNDYPGFWTGWTELFLCQGWPVELILVSIIFCQFMIAQRNIWLLIPAGLLFGEGLLLSYFSVSGQWNHWSFLWPLQVFVIMVVLWYTITRAYHLPRWGN